MTAVALGGLLAVLAVALLLPWIGIGVTVDDTEDPPVDAGADAGDGGAP